MIASEAVAAAAGLVTISIDRGPVEIGAEAVFVAAASCGAGGRSERRNRFT
jgi:hypothetical protein